MPDLSRSPVVRYLFLIALALPALAAERSPHDPLEQPCTACHTTASWTETVFDHSATDFPLRGAHAGSSCLACHRVERFSQLGMACGQCHTDFHQAALGSDCALCHGEEAWVPNHFAHDATAFPLWGAHAATSCIECHVNETTFQFTSAPQTCFDCHETDFATSRTVVHQTAGPDCQTCHTQDTWRGGHDPMWMEIRGGHHEQSCQRCHKLGEDYASHTCVDCHKFSPQVPEHRGIDPLDARCKECHPTNFHDTVAGFRSE
jgi:hypothetical protein